MKRETHLYLPLYSLLYKLSKLSLKKTILLFKIWIVHKIFHTFLTERANCRWTASTEPSIKIVQMSFSSTLQNELCAVQMLLKDTSSLFNPVIDSQYVTVSLSLFKKATVMQYEDNHIFLNFFSGSIIDKTINPSCIYHSAHFLFGTS